MEWIVLGFVALLAFGVKKGAPVIQTVEKSLNRSKFRSDFLAAAKNVDWKGIPVNFALAHADVESGTGTGSVYLKTKNLFSITVGSGWKGHWNGETYKAASGLVFRAYNSLEDSMRDWIDLMHFQIYAEALKYALENNFRGFAYAVKKVGYDASEPKYAEILIDRYNAISAEV